ncbi:hypothetical protein O7599_18345 [Streptomyces sp. WMMC500]|uniref:hypothetical protein n=1 Tax=Streptomyces sp. WMMC500 TaxID=3015154 RepID=UPI00248BAA99|nr:hypothetical protein [Streptomyces sp. WMMC500]WBB64344.1 hypothetical protein O7599_18345 [Streptomyces sp. WMMC500]
MNAFLTELGRNLASRWASHLVPAGLLFLGTVALGTLLGHADWYDVTAAAERVDALAGSSAARSAGGVALAATAVLLASAGTALAVQAFATVVEDWWTGSWPRPAAPLTRRRTARRHDRWTAAEAAFQRAVEEAATAPTASRGHLAPADRARIDRLNAARNRIALVEPTRPTWAGDRVHAVDERVLATYGLDLDSGWSRLWLILPEAARTELRTAREAYDAALRLLAWSVPYGVLAAWWWPAALIAAGTFLAGWRRGRAATDALAELVESSVDLYGRRLATAVGLPTPGPLTHPTGQAVTRVLRKGT